MIGEGALDVAQKVPQIGLPGIAFPATDGGTGRAPRLRPASPPRAGTQDEATPAAVLASLGLHGPAAVVLPPDGTLPADHGLRWPLVVKLVSPDLPHRTGAGAIRVGMADPAELSGAIATMKQSAAAYRPGDRLTGVLVQEMCRGPGEALVGLTRDPGAGPTVTLAMGGVRAEIYRDSAVRPAPVDPATAREMPRRARRHRARDATARARIAEVCGMALFSGDRNRPRGDLAARAAAVAGLSRLALSPRIAEAEVTPLPVPPGGEGLIMPEAFINIAGPAARSLPRRGCRGQRRRGRKRAKGKPYDHQRHARCDRRRAFALHRRRCRGCGHQRRDRHAQPDGTGLLAAAAVGAFDTDRRRHPVGGP